MLRQKSFLSFLLNVAGSFFAFIAVFFIAHYMGPDAIGAISSTTAFVGLFAIFGDLGFGLAHYKKVSEGKDLGKCVGTFSVIRLGTTIIMAFITIIILYGSYFFTGKYPFETKYLSLFYIIFGSAFLGNLLYVISYTFAARVEKAKEGIVLITQKASNSLLRVVVAISGLGIIWLAWSNLAGVIIGMIAALLLFRKYPVGKFDYSLFKDYESRNYCDRF